MANSADPDQLASSTDLDLHCLQMQGVSGFSRTRVNELGNPDADRSNLCSWNYISITARVKCLKISLKFTLDGHNSGIYPQLIQSIV